MRAPVSFLRVCVFMSVSFSERACSLGIVSIVRDVSQPFVSCLCRGLTIVMLLGSAVDKLVEGLVISSCYRRVHEM